MTILLFAVQGQGVRVREEFEYYSRREKDRTGEG